MRKINREARLPNKAIVATTLLAGGQPCITCGLTCAENLIVCEVCDKALPVTTQKDLKDFNAYRDKPGRPKWFRDSRSGWVLTPEQLAEELAGERTKRQLARGNKSSGLSRKSRSPRAKAASDSSEGSRRRALLDHFGEPHQALGPETKIAPYSYPVVPRSSSPPGSGTPTGAFGSEPRRKVASNRQLARLCMKSPAPLRRDLERSYQTLRSCGYGARVALFYVQKQVPWHQKLSSLRSSRSRLPRAFPVTRP